MDLTQTKVNLYADNNILYTFDTSLKETINYLQSAFSLVQRSLVGLKLVLNPRNATEGSAPIERLTYQYLGIWLDVKLICILFVS